MKNLFLLFMISVNLFAQTEILINTYTDSTQRAPVAARDILGNYVIAWQSINQFESGSAFDIYYQKFDSNGDMVGVETIANSFTDNDQERPAIDMNDNGEFVIVWASMCNNENELFDIHAYLETNASGNLIQKNIEVNTTKEYSQTKPSVAMNSAGEFIVVWESWYQDGSDRGVFGQRFHANGDKAGGEFQINSTSAYSQARPRVKYFPNGNFIVTWESWKQDIATPSGYGIFGKIFSSDASIIKDEFQINTYTNDYQWFGDVDVKPDNSFVVVWCSWGQDGHDGGIYAQNFDVSGNKSGAEKLINKTSVYYQWLPKIRILSNGNVGVVWSSWLQDGSREGVYLKILDNDLNNVSFETQANDYTDNYQWEPDLIPSEGNELLVTWASWGQYNEYDIIAKKITPVIPEAVIGTKTYEHNSGTSTTRVFVHVIDSTAITGDSYEVTFNVEENTALANIKNVNSGADVVSNFSIDRGEGIFYITHEFEGVAVEFVPKFSFELDTENSYFVNNSGTNINFTVSGGLGAKELAPIDFVIIWGSADTLSDGKYAFPLDSAYNQSGQKQVKTPFYAWNITDNEKMDLVIIEPSQSRNLKWDAKEEIGILTPAKYATAFPRYHASLISNYSGSLIMPGSGDTNYVFTVRPLTSEDKFTFQTKREYLTTGASNEILNPVKFELMQNYPNPFNPSTTIMYSVPKDGRVNISVYNLLGQKIASPVNGIVKRGTHKILFDASGLASGMYFYNIRFENKSISRKMLLLK